LSPLLVLKDDVSQDVMMICTLLIAGWCAQISSSYCQSAFSGKSSLFYLSAVSRCSYSSIFDGALHRRAI